MDNLLTVQEVANLLQKRTDTILKAIKRGDLKATKFGRQWAIRQEDFEEYKTNPPKVGRPSNKDGKP